MKKKIAVLGATGSIGKNTLDIIFRDPENFEVVLLSAHSRLEELQKLKLRCPGAVCVFTGKEGAEDIKKDLIRAIKDLRPDITLNGISGAAGLEPSLAAIEAGSDLALANKETIVMAAPLVFRLAQEKNVNIIPVDSEHSAIFHLIGNFCKSYSSVSEILLTASGGPFRNLSLKEMEKVTAKEALAHPTWNMGPKITIDSATMANKGLEIIEACALFNMSVDKVKIAIHPQSIVHSMVKHINGVFYAQLSKPDMRHPIHDALYWPNISPLNIDTLSFDSLTLEFFSPDVQKFPMLNLAKEAAKKGGFYPCAYNAANEVAVDAFIKEKIGFLDIAKITETILQEDWTTDNFDKEAVLKADLNARCKTVNYLNRVCL